MRALIVLLLTLVAANARAADAPGWLLDASRLAPAPVDGNADAVVLLDDFVAVVAADGRLTTTRRVVMRVLTPSGRRAMALREVVGTTTGRVRTARGWAIVDGRVTDVGRNQVAIVALADNDVYNESRAYVVAPADDLPVGAVFGAEIEVEDRSVFTQFAWLMQREHPARRISRTLVLPSGAEVTATTFNQRDLAPDRIGDRYTWAVTDAAALPDEPFAPPLDRVAPMLAVTYRVPTSPAPAFTGWPEVSRWLASLADPRAVATGPVAQTSASLTSASAAPMELRRTLAEFVQRVQYISIQTGIGRGGGYQPHLAAEVPAKNYGDCKDKVNLLRALLAHHNVRTRVVAAYLGDPDSVRPEWPSPQQFNHAIIAIAVPPGTTGPAVGQDAELGPVLFFDPTDAYTPFGHLPESLAGSWVLPATADGAGLVRLPGTTAGRRLRHRQMRGTLDADGAFRGTVTYTSHGEWASLERARRQLASRDDETRRLASALPRGTTVVDTTFADDPAENRVDRVVTVQTPGLAQRVTTSLLVVRPLPATLDVPTTLGASRLLPVHMTPLDERDTMVLTLPAGLKVDGAPAPESVKSEFGEASLAWTLDGATVTRVVEVRIPGGAYPPAQAGALDRFLMRVRELTQQPLPLARSSQ